MQICNNSVTWVVYLIRRNIDTNNNQTTWRGPKNIGGDPPDAEETGSNSIRGEARPNLCRVTKRRYKGAILRLGEAPIVSSRIVLSIDFCESLLT